MKTTGKMILLLTTTLFLSGCGVVDQATKAYNLVNCDFRIQSVEDITLAGINVQYISNIRELSWSDAAKLMKAVASPTFPLSFQLNFEVKNPNPSPAGMNQLEYIVFIDDIQMASGSLNQPFTIPPNNGTAIVPMQISADLKQVLQGKSLESVVNFGLNLSGAGNKPTRFMVKLKPSVMINGKPMTYPGYITVRTEYSGS
jgi:hypothetical protein